MPTPIRMVSLDIFTLEFTGVRANRIATEHAVLAIPVQGDGIWVECSAEEAIDAADTINDEWALGGDHPMQRFARALRKAAGA